MQAKKQNAKEVILTIVVGLLLVFYFTKINIFLWLSIAIGLLGIFSDLFAEKLTWAWMKLAEVMGKIMSPILLGAVFYLFLTPIAFLQKIFGKTDNLKFKNPADSVYDTRNHEYKAGDLEDLW